MSVFLAPRIIVFLLTIIAGLPRDGYQYNYASSDGVKKVLDRDVNGDGKADLVIAVSNATNSLATALGSGDGLFAAPVKTPLTRSAYALALGDVTGDGRPDALSLQGKDLVVQAGSGDGSFLAEQNTPFAIQSAGSSSGLTLADLDGDGRLDVIAANPAEQDISVLFGQPTGYTAASLLALSSQPALVAVSDYNQDGVLDLLIGLSRSARKVELMQGLGNRSFGPLPSLALSVNVRLEAQGDLNGDGLADLLALDAGALDNNVYYFLGRGRASFVGRPALSAPPGAVAAAVGDWDGDGRQDALTISTNGDSICVLRNTSP